MEDFQICRSFVSLLNAQLEDIGGEAIQNRVEIARRGPTLFFITCKHNPRFNWRPHLTHLDIGRNLDYSAAGHIFHPPLLPRAIIQFTERSMNRIFGEFVLLETLRNEKSKGELYRFNTAKENLFNYTMQRLALPYRFKWVLIVPEKVEGVGVAISSNIPPSQEWWEGNCVYASGAGLPGVPPGLGLFSFETQFDKYWPLIQFAYNFLPKFYKIPCDCEYWNVERVLFNEIRRTLNQGVAFDRSVIDDFKVRLESATRGPNTTYAINSS
jgi:hypothetical protein